MKNSLWSVLGFLIFIIGLRLYTIERWEYEYAAMVGACILGFWYGMFIPRREDD